MHAAFVFWGCDALSEYKILALAGATALIFLVVVWPCCFDYTSLFLCGRSIRQGWTEAGSVHDMTS